LRREALSQESRQFQTQVIENNKHLEASIARTKAGRLKIGRKPYFKLEFTNGTILRVSQRLLKNLYQTRSIPCFS